MSLLYIKINWNTENENVIVINENLIKTVDNTLEGTSGEFIELKYNSFNDIIGYRDGNGVKYYYEYGNKATVAYSDTI